MPPKKKKPADDDSSDASDDSDSVSSVEPSAYGCYVMGNMKLTAGAQVNPEEILDFPTREPSFTQLGVDIRQAAGGMRHVVVVADDGKVYGWGCNASGQLGLDPEKTPYCYKWTLIKQLASKKVCKVACGGHHTLALTHLGMVFAMGNNKNAQLGTTRTKTHRHDPQPVPKLCLVKDISAGGDASYAVDKAGDLFMWGLNKNGMSGNPYFEGLVVEKPQKVPIFEELGNEVEEVVSSSNHVIARSGQLLYTFGCGEYGKLGLNDINPKTQPVELEFGHGKSEGTPEIVVSPYSTLILTKLTKQNTPEEHRMLRGCGRIGTAGVESVLTPTEIKQQGLGCIKKVQASRTAQAYLTEEGDVYMWGSGPHGLFNKHVEGSKRTIPQHVTMLAEKKATDFVMTEYFTMVFTNERESENSEEELKIPVFGRYPRNPSGTDKKFTYETCRKRFKVSCEENETCEDCSEASFDGPTREVVGASGLTVGDEVSLWVGDVWAWGTIRDTLDNNKFQIEWVRDDWNETMEEVELLSDNEDVDCASPDRWTYGFYEFWDSDSDSESSSSSSEEEEDDGSDEGSGKKSDANESGSEGGSSESSTAEPAPKKTKAARKPAAKRGKGRGGKR